MANAVVPYHHVNGPREVQVFEPGAWAIRLHFRVYRACCNQLNNLALFVFCQVSSPLKTCFQQARNVSVVDYCYTTTLRGINRISQKVFDYELIDSESCKTLKQKQREREIAIFRASLGENTVYSKFCRATASYISEAIPNVIGEKLEALPGFTEGWLLYRLGLPLRYINYQLIKKTGYREELISSQFSKSFKGNYCGLRTRLAHLLLGKHNLDPILDFEHLLLQLFVKIMEPSQGDRSQKCIGAAVRSLAQSFSYQEHIDRYLAELPLRSDEEALIARLEWHKTHDTLPKGVPDPHQERLTPSNLYEKFEEALYKYTESLVEKLVDRYSPPSMKRGLSGFVYFLEGRDASIRLLTHLVAEFGIKQLTDPHLFSLAILYACNEDIMDYELDGFGRRKKDTIIDVGQEMMNAMLEKNFSWSSTLALFEDSGLRHTPGSLEGIMQKTEAKEQLRRYIASIIHEMIKEDDFQHKTGVLRAIRRKTKRFPVVGVATVSLHVLINGMFFSLGYPFRDIKQEETTFLKWMFKHMTGKGLCNYLADRVVDLIYHPSWR
ncbi:MAG: hypothetical protein ACE5GN_05985 [Waddliaceae bacterium]